MTTYGHSDASKVLAAMRALAYDKLVILCEGDTEESGDLGKIVTLEEMANHTLQIERVRGLSFMDVVNEISEILTSISDRLARGSGDKVVLNISGGSKLVGDAALFAAFRLGIEAYHCDSKVTRLPVLRGATARDRFTSTQLRVLGVLGCDWKDLGSVVGTSNVPNRQGILRVLRELQKADLVKTQAAGGSIHVALTDAGLEAKRAACVS